MIPKFLLSVFIFAVIFDRAFASNKPAEKPIGYVTANDKLWVEYATVGGKIIPYVLTETIGSESGRGRWGAYEQGINIRFENVSPTKKNRAVFFVLRRKYGFYEFLRSFSLFD